MLKGTLDINRRKFLKMLSAAMTTIAFNIKEDTESTSELADVSVQLYSVRRQLEKNYKSTLSAIASIGYTGVELFPLPPGLEPKEVARYLKQLDLRVVGIHVDYPMGRTSIEDVLRFCDIYDCNMVVYAGWPEGDKYSNEAMMAHTVEHYNAAAERLSNYDIRFALHNHWYEFEPHNGFIPFIYLLQHLSQQVLFEIDIYWTAVAGMNVVEVVQQFAPRIALLHVKDGHAQKGDAMFMQTVLGEGRVNIPAVFDVLKNHTFEAIVEFDEYDGDIFDALQKSYVYMTTKKFVKGKCK